MKTIWTDHIRDQMKERNISREMVELTISNPLEIVCGNRKNRIVYHRLFGKKLLRVIVQKNALVSVYLTSKAKKYLKKES